MQAYDWKWGASEVEFKPSYSVHEPEFGKQAHGFMSPFWLFDLSLPPKDKEDRRDIESFLAETEGKAVVNVYDPRVQYPAIFAHLAKSNPPQSLVSNVRVRAMDKSASTITVSGEANDYITVGDPIGFTHEGVRYYFKAHHDLRLDGTDQLLKVFIRPRKTITGLALSVDRIRPTCRFLVDINNTLGRTTPNGFTAFTLRGVEFWGSIDAG